MIADLSFQPPVGLAPVVGFQAPVAVAPALGFQPPVARKPDVGLTRAGSFQMSLGLSTPMIDYNSPQRLESFSLLERSGSSLAALRLKMSERFRGNSETFRASASETWRPSSYTYKTPDIVG